MCIKIIQKQFLNSYVELAIGGDIFRESAAKFSVISARLSPWFLRF